MPGKPKSKQRSGCPSHISLEILGDRWSLLIIRDLMIRGFRTFKDFQGSGEEIQRTYSRTGCRNSRRRGSLAPARTRPTHEDVNYRLTEKGIDLAPVLLEFLISGARHEETMARELSSFKWNRTVTNFLLKCVDDGKSATRLP